jgi:hypothetical protein
VDYWTDNDVFAHFIDQVVCAPKPTETEGKTTPKPKPASKWPAIIVSYAVPKLLIAALMCIAVYAIYRPVSAAVAATPVPSKQIFTDVLGLGLLLLGVTAAARLPRLTNKWRWWLVSAGCLVLAMAAYEKLVHDDSRALIGALFAGTPLGPTTALKPSLSSSRSLRERSRAGSPRGGRASCRSWGCSRSSASCAT